MKRLVLIVFAAILGMGLLAALTGRASMVAENPAAVATVSAKSKGAMFAEDNEGRDRTVIARDQSGQFRIPARINNSDAEFLIDTGADVVALTVGSAQEAGIPVDPASFQPMMQTANGTGNGARYVVDNLEIAGRPFHDVEVIVMEGLSTNLLGQTMLKRLGRVELAGDRMVIERN